MSESQPLVFRPLLIQMVFRRFSSSSQPPREQPPAGVSRAATVGHSNNPYRSEPPSMQSLSLDDNAPPPPDYNTALRASISGPPPGHVPPPIHAAARPQSLQPQQQQQQQYRQQPPPQQQTRPQSQPPPAQAGPAPTVGVRRRTSIEDPLAPLGKYDIVVLIDDSPSMLDHWDETRTALMAVVEKCVKYDKDGIDVRFMNAEDHNLNNVTDASTVREAFEDIVPYGSTPTAMALDDILRSFVDDYEDAKAGKGGKTKDSIRNTIVVVLTDGRADDVDGVRDCIVEMAGRLDAVKAPPFALGVQFIQVGSDEDATAFLAELDDDLKGDAGVRDMVDTTPYQGRIDAEFILKAALGSVVKRLDNS